MILAIETSCDETAAAIVDQNRVRSNVVFSQIKKHQQYGGVVPELASRLHAESIDIVIQKALEEASVTLQQLTHIAVTVGPGLEGALLIGITAANTLAKALNIPVVPVNHLHGHIFSAASEHSMTFPMLACIASGGHTMLVYMESYNQYKIVANTTDDACGECFDKVARMLDLPYPGGPSIEHAAQSGTPSITFPHPVKHKPDQFSFSGLKTAVLLCVKSYDKDPVPVSDIAASVQDTIATVLAHKIALALDTYSVKQVMLCGGVFSNKVLRKTVLDACQGVDCIMAPLEFCTDNAAMIGLAAQNYIKDHKVVAQATCQLRLGLRFPEVS
jgi:N6-L-threonylcarbamoyladenine synthase